MNIAEIVGRLRAEGNTAKSFFEQYEDPQPLEETALARLRLPTGDALPDDLASWLAYDGSWLGLMHSGQLRASTLRDWLTRLAGELAEIDEDEDEELREMVGDGEVSDERLVAWWIGLLPSPELADAWMVPLPSGDQDNLLMLEPGRNQLRVLGFHKYMELWWKYDTFADYLAHWFGFEER